MNPANLTARIIRQSETGFPPSPPPIGHDFASTPAQTSPAHAPEKDPLSAEPPPPEDIRRLRHALAQMLTRATGEEIHSFEGPVATNERLCTIADNIWNDRPWSSA